MASRPSTSHGRRHNTRERFDFLSCRLYITQVVACRPNLSHIHAHMLGAAHTHPWSHAQVMASKGTLESWRIGRVSLRRYVKPPMMQGLLALKPWVREQGCSGLRRNRRGLTEVGDPRARFEEEEFCWLVVELGVGGRDESKRQGLNLSGSWQQGHSATYNTPSRI